MEEKKKKKQIAKISVFITSIFVMFMSVTYAFISQTLTGTKEVVINAGVLDLVLEEENAITISNALPMHDEVGMTQEDVFNFRLVNKTANPTNYVLKMTKIEADNELSISDVKYYLTKEEAGEPKLLSSLPTNGTVDSGTIAGNDTIDYTLRLWIDSSVTDEAAISGKSLSYRIDAEASQKIEWVANFGKDTSGANVPRLTSGMIPVVYDENNKVWVKANISNQENYYNYDSQIWANAVTVTENSRDYYMTMDSGKPISMDDINTMWVWIPRYEYQYTDLGTNYAGGTETEPGEIKIKFISSNTLIPSDSTKYQIPEGFKFGEENIAGFWIGKFETSTLESCTATNGSINEECDLTTLTPQIKPNVTSWRGARVSTFFQASRLMQSPDTNLIYNADTYGFDAEGISSMDTHMLKNSEWGIVAMLSQSKYGKYGNSNYIGAEKEIYQNKSTTFLTGMSNGTPSTSIYSDNQATYDTPNTGYGASTTGTIYGVYDMSGGSFEYVMGNYNKYSGYTSNYGYNSGFCGTNGPSSGCRKWPDSKYYDMYTSKIVSETYKFGDATYETSGWYSDYMSFVTTVDTWIERGNAYAANMRTGIFNLGSNVGNAIGGYSTRFAIKP